MKKETLFVVAAAGVAVYLIFKTTKKTTSAQPIVRPAGYVPAYRPDTTGEEQASAYYQSHLANFTAQVPDYAIVNSTPWAQDAINDPSEN